MKIVEKTKATIHIASKGYQKYWDSLPEASKTGTKLVGAEIALGLISAATRNKSRMVSKATRIVAIGCYAIAMGCLYKGVQDSIYSYDIDHDQF